ncbi:MAG: formimidoylglutamase [Chitinophagaceae bacterium]|nr:formimidoylglutamase [Chitinophagaceae bacterium]
MDIAGITDFLTPLKVEDIFSDDKNAYRRIGHTVSAYIRDFPDTDEAHYVIVGCNEFRGSGIPAVSVSAPDVIRKHFYSLYKWHDDVRLADIGNIKTGSAYADTCAALKTVLRELMENGKRVILLGGSHDLTLSQYQAYAEQNKGVEVVCIDALIDLNPQSGLPHENFLMDMLTTMPNYVRHYNHIGFQSFYVHPDMLETLDKLRFDCFRVGHVKENLDEMEPVLRNSQMLSIDISALAFAFAPANTLSPNGFSGEEICELMRYAGMSHLMNSIGIYGYQTDNDYHEMTAKQIAHMLWYLCDGFSRGRRESSLDEKESFNEFHTFFAEVETTFLQSKKTGRWWMQLPDKRFIACSYKDYLLASSNEIPERWLRAQERS